MKLLRFELSDLSNNGTQKKEPRECHPSELSQPGILLCIEHSARWGGEGDGSCHGAPHGRGGEEESDQAGEGDQEEDLQGRQQAV